MKVNKIKKNLKRQVHLMVSVPTKKPWKKIVLHKKILLYFRFTTKYFYRSMQISFYYLKPNLVNKIYHYMAKLFMWKNYFDHSKMKETKLLTLNFLKLKHCINKYLKLTSLLKFHTYIQVPKMKSKFCYLKIFLVHS